MTDSEVELAKFLEFCEVIRYLRYLVIVSRPEIMFAVDKVVRVNSFTLKRAKNFLGYVFGTEKICLVQGTPIPQHIAIRYGGDSNADFDDHSSGLIQRTSRISLV